MEHLPAVLRLLVWPLAICIIIGVLHAYAGLHVLRRGVIFVDLALAQMAALGTVAGAFFEHHELQPAVSYAESASSTVGDVDELDQAIRQTGLTRVPVVHTVETDHNERGFLSLWPTAFALFGAILLAYGRLPAQRIPHEAIIGVVYVVAAATTVLLLSKSPHAHEQMEEMLTGKLLFVGSREVLHTGIVYAVLGVLYWIFFRPFLAISTSPVEAEARGMRVRLWDCLFYGMFAILVTRSVAVAGVLVVFTLLIIPGACAAVFVEDFRMRMIVAWLISIFIIVIGLGVSAAADLPSGSTLVATFGAALVVCLALGGTMRRTISSRAGP